MITINKKSITPVYKQIVEQIVNLIAINRIRPGERLPTVKQLALQLKVNPCTVHMAYRELDKQGIAYGHGRPGKYVSTEIQEIRIRQERLNNLVDLFVAEITGQGYTREEIRKAVINYEN